MSERYPGGVITKNAIVPTPSSAPGVWTLDQQLQAKQAGIWPYGGPLIYIEDVFSTYLYTGTGSSQTITNGIDLSTNGGLVWNKSRSNAYVHCLTDTARGVGNSLDTSDTAANDYSITRVSAFNANGFTMGGNSRTNASSATYASWTFRKQAKFFDVVTYTGTGASSQTISHSLASVPGFIAIKRTDSTGDWVVIARSSSNGQYYCLQNATTPFGFNSTNAAYGTVDFAGMGYLSSTTFLPYVFGGGNSSSSGTNISGATYVAYLFAHNAGGFGLTGTDNVISCGSFTTDTSGNFTTTLGYEPQWILFKNSGAASNWNLIDNMRGWPVGAGSSFLRPNTSGAETTDSTPYMIPTATGFAGINNGWGNTQTYIYIAIRRGPMKTPTSGTSVFAPVARTGTGTATTTSNLSFPPDFLITHNRDSNPNGTQTLFDRLRGATPYLFPQSTSGEGTNASALATMGQNGIGFADDTAGFNNYSSVTYVDWNFRRAPGFFDEVCYTGTGSANVQNHNLGVAPELVILKSRSTGGVGYNWPAITNTTVSSAATLFLNSATSNNGGNSSGMFTSTTINLGNTTGLGSLYGNQANQSGVTFVAYLFASCPGVSKVGSYTGTGALQTINCGFTGGARFVLIKRTDSTGDWYVWDSARGIVAGNDPYLLLNSTAAEVTNTDYVDTYSAGFEISSTAPAAINANGGTFIFLAIA